MIGPLAKDKVTLRRQKGRRPRTGPAPYVQVLDASECPVSLRCRIFQGGRRVNDREGNRFLGDARMKFNTNQGIKLKKNDLVVATDRVTDEEVVYKVLRIEGTNPIGARGTYAMATMERTEQEVAVTAESTDG